jgi:long-chain acyl-CoA synthetase
LSWLQVRDIHLSPIAFTVENDLLTPTLKSKRPQLILAYKQQLKDMNDNID